MVASLHLSIMGTLSGEFCANVQFMRLSDKYCSFQFYIETFLFYVINVVRFGVQADRASFKEIGPLAEVFLRNDPVAPLQQHEIFTIMKFCLWTEIVSRLVRFADLDQCSF